MEVKHCKHVIDTWRERVLKSTPLEEQRGVLHVIAREYWCPDNDCRKRLFYKKEIYQNGESEWARIRPHQRASFVARLRRARESDWVWGFNPETFGKVKVMVE